MGLYKKEVLVRPNSTADFETAMNFAQNWMMSNFQDDPENKDADGNYIDYFFADVFFAPGHPLGGQTWRIFTPPCADKYSMDPVATGRIEYKVTDLLTVEERLAAAEAAGTAQDRRLGEIVAELDEHEDRIVALENSGNEVEATVI